jgi:hypothetical protein
MGIKVFRGGRRAPQWSGTGANIWISTSPAGSGELVCFSINFSLPSRGAGTIDVRVQVQSDSFKEVAAAMMQADADAAVKAFGATLRRGIKP